MGIIAKPVTFVAGTTKAGEASQVNSDFDTLYTEFNGNISDANVLALANIQQSKILNLVGDLATIRATRFNEVAVQIFTNTVGVNTYTKTSDVLMVQIIVIAGGGGGGSPNLASVTFRTGGGGGGGAMAFSYLPVTAIGSSEIVTVGGAGGAGTLGNPGNLGGNSSFGTLVIASGGTGGVAAPTDDTVAEGGFGGQGAAGQMLIGGSDAGHGLAGTLGALIGGSGGASPMGGGGKGAAAGVPAGVGRNFGGGGGGGISSSSGASLGAVGANGLVIVVEYKS